MREVGKNGQERTPFENVIYDQHVGFGHSLNINIIWKNIKWAWMPFTETPLTDYQKSIKHNIVINNIKRTVF